MTKVVAQRGKGGTWWNKLEHRSLTWGSTGEKKWGILRHFGTLAACKVRQAYTVTSSREVRAHAERGDRLSKSEPSEKLKG